MAGEVPIGRIRPVAPSPSLLSVARLIPDVQPADWARGVAWSSGCQPSYAWERCQGPFDSIDPKVAAMSQDVYRTRPFTVYTPAECDLPTDGDDLADLVSELDQVHTPAAIAAALWVGTGVADPDDDVPTLRRAAQDVSAAAAYDFDDGVAALLVHYDQCTGGSGGAIIHAPAALAVSALGGGSGGARVCWPEGNLYRGPLGSMFSFGPGYPEGFSPDGPNGNGPLAAPFVGSTYAGNEANRSWVYVSGPVEYQVGPIAVLPDQERDRTPFRTNLYQVWAERDAIVRFDPCCVFAVEVVNPAPLIEVS